MYCTCFHWVCWLLTDQITKFCTLGCVCVWMCVVCDYLNHYEGFSYCLTIWCVLFFLPPPALRWVPCGLELFVLFRYQVTEIVPLCWGSFTFWLKSRLVLFFQAYSLSVYHHLFLVRTWWVLEFLFCEGNRNVCEVEGWMS